MDDHNVEPGDLVRIHERRKDERRKDDYVEGIVTACRGDAVDVLVMRCGPRSKYRSLFRRATESLWISAALSCAELISKAPERAPRPSSAQRDLF
jgi:hypothetical protein